MDNHNDSSALSLHRSTSQVSSASARSSSRALSVRTKTKPKKLTSQPSSSASSIAASDKSLTSFPSFSPKSPRRDTPLSPDNYADQVSSARNASLSISSATTPPNPSNHPTNARNAAPPSIVDSLLSDAQSDFSDDTHRGVGSGPARPALFDDTPNLSRNIPGALHLAEDDHIDRLIVKHGPINLVRQIAEDLALRDTQVAALRRRADEREQALRRIILECGLSNLELETKLRTVEADLKARNEAKRGQDGGLSNMMNDAMGDSVSFPSAGGLGITAAAADGNTTIRIKGEDKDKDAQHHTTKGTMRALKDYFWGGGTGKKSTRASTPNTTAPSNDATPKTAIRTSTHGDRRPALQDDLFTPPDSESFRSSSRASSRCSGQDPRKPSNSLASKTLQLVAGKPSSVREADLSRGRSLSAGRGGSVRAGSTASTKAHPSVRAASTQSGPRASKPMRRATLAPGPSGPRASPSDRWGTNEGTPPSSTAPRPDHFSLVEMDTMDSPEAQSPARRDMYGPHHGVGPITDRYGFILKQRRGGQREATQMSVQTKGGKEATEGLPETRPGHSAKLLDDESSIHTLESEGHPQTHTSMTMKEAAGPKNENTSEEPENWQACLRITTTSPDAKPTDTEPYSKMRAELLSHTPSMPASTTQVLEGSRTSPRSPPGITSGQRGFVPPAVPPASTTAAVNTEPVASSGREADESLKSYLKTLNKIYDDSQKKKSVFLNQFLQNVQNKDAAGRSQEAPEEKMPGGETIGIASLDIGKLGNDKWRTFKNRVVLKGIPEVYRATIWAKASEALSLREPGRYAELVLKSKNKMVIPRTKVEDEIDKDIPRTLTNNVYFRREKKGSGVERSDEKRPDHETSRVERSDDKRPDDETSDDESSDEEAPNKNESQGDKAPVKKEKSRRQKLKKSRRRKLKAILPAYARHNPEVGYCQGMNSIAANLVLATSSEEDAFWILVSIIEDIFPRGYFSDLIALDADQHVLRQYVRELLGGLSEHLDRLGADLTMMTHRWFLLIFTDCLSGEDLFRVWDVVLCTNRQGSEEGGKEGSTFLFSVALALLKHNEAQLLKCAEEEQVYTHISQKMMENVTNIDQLIQTSARFRTEVRHEDVQKRRKAAIEAEEKKKAAAAQRKQEAALVTDAATESEPSPLPSPSIGFDGSGGHSSMAASVASLNAAATGRDHDSEGRQSRSHQQRFDDEDVETRSQLVQPPTPAEEEAVLGLG